MTKRKRAATVVQAAHRGKRWLSKMSEGDGTNVATLTGTVISRKQLDNLAASIKRHHAECGRLLKGGLEHAIKAGNSLTEAKAAIGHGAWLAWIEGNCGLSARQAQRYMQLAKSSDQLANATRATHLPERLADVSMRQALATVTKTNRIMQAIPVEKQTAALKAAEAGGPPVKELARFVSHPRHHEPAITEAPQQEAEPLDVKGVGVLRAQEAINSLTRIPKDDALRARAWEIVRDWLDAHK